MFYAVQILSCLNGKSGPGISRGLHIAAANHHTLGGETASASKEPVVKAPARSSESELDIMVED